MNIKKFIAGITSVALMGTAMAFGSVISASADEDVLGTVYLWLNNGVYNSETPSENNPAVDITGNGSYTVSVDIPEDGAAESILLLILQSDINIYQTDENENKLFDNMVFSVDSIYVDGNEIEYTGPSSGAVGTHNDGISYRLNILNTWGNDVKDIDGSIVNSSNVTVNFTVSGLAVDKVGDETTSEETTVTSEEETTVTSIEDTSVVVTTTTPAETTTTEATTTTTAVTTTSTGTVTTTATTVANKVDYSLYNSIINKAGKTVSDNGYNQLHDNLGYYLFDINGDGVQELIIADSFETQYDEDKDVNYVWCYYDIYTIQNGKLVEVDQTITANESGDKLLYLDSTSYLSLAVVDGKLSFIAVDDDGTTAYAYPLGIYEESNGTLAIDIEDQISGTVSEFEELKLYSYTDKTALNELTGTVNANYTNGTSNTGTTSDTTKSDSPSTGDTGLGAVAVTLTVAGLSALALKKRD